MTHHPATTPESARRPDGCKPAGTASKHLQRLSKEAARKGGLSVAEMVAVMGNGSIAFTILILALPALTPIPGPFGLVFGTCLAVISLQIICGAQHLTLPGFVVRRRLSAATVAVIVRHTAPVIARVERLLQPGRLPALAGSVAQRLLGIPVYLLAITIALPIPFGNFLPVIALVVIAAALLEADGLATVVGLGLSVMAFSATVGLLYGAYSATTWAMG